MAQFFDEHRELLFSRAARSMAGRLQPDQTVTHELKPGRGAWLQIAEGALALNGVALATGDGASTEEPGTLKLSANAAR